MDLSKLCPWNWLCKPEPEPKGLVVRRVDEDGEDWPDPDSPDCVGYELERLFDHAFSGFGFSAPHLQAALEAERATVPPRFRVDAAPDRTSIVVDLPGVREQDISLSLRGRTLTVLALRNADRAEPDPERAAFKASFQLGPEADLDAITASCQGCQLVLVIAHTKGPAPTRDSED